MRYVVDRDDWDDEDHIDTLSDLENLFDDLDIDEPSKAQIYKMYGIFLNDFVKNPITINGRKISYNRNKSKHPICKGKVKAFEHIITRESKYKGGDRDFDRERANKIHWIRPIIENVEDARIKYFEHVNSDGDNQRYYWYEEKGFIVIIREYNPDYFLITSFSVDTDEKSYYKKLYYTFNEKRKNKKTPLRE